MMQLTLVNLYSDETAVSYLLSSYILKAYLDKVFQDRDLLVTVLNVHYKTAASKICVKITKQKPDYVGYSCYTWNIENIRTLLSKIGFQMNYYDPLAVPNLEFSGFPEG